MDAGSASDGGDTFNGGNETDTADYSRRTSNVNVTLDGTGNDGETGEQDNVKADVEDVNGGGGDDNLTAQTASSVQNALNGNAGDDTLDGGPADGQHRRRVGR